jgi:hypothetical protein
MKAQNIEISCGTNGEACVHIFLGNRTSTTIPKESNNDSHYG